jgi:hypothetical protein
VTSQALHVLLLQINCILLTQVIYSCCSTNLLLLRLMLMLMLQVKDVC